MNPDYMQTSENSAFCRRAFLSTSTKAVGAVLLGLPILSLAKVPAADKITVGQITDLFIKEVPGAPFENTVDTLKAGDREIIVTGVVTCMFATIEVIQKTIDLGANFIIAHEPTFYNHADDTEWLQLSEVYQYKAGLLKQHNIAVWRNHDYIHRHVPDGVISSVVDQLQWTKYYDTNSHLANIPDTTVEQIIQHAKTKLGIEQLRYIGDLKQVCKRVLIMPGAAGGKRQIEGIINTQPDVLITGEIQEWETAEYVRDARAKGQNISLIVLGHIASEAPGSDYMVTWLHQNIPAIKAVHVSSKNSLKFM